MLKRFFKKTIIKKNNKGFTLVEMIVSLAIFSIVALVAVGALLKITDANKKSITLKTAINNLNYALESMSREMRVGSSYAYLQQSSTDWVITFLSSKRGANGDCNLQYSYQYIYDSYTKFGKLQKAEQADCGRALDYYDILSANVNITNTVVKMENIGQPRMFFWFKGYSGVKGRNETEFSIQTSVSQRAGI